MVLEDPLDARVAPAEHDPLAVADLLDDAFAIVDAQRRVLLGLELHVLAEPLLELGRLGDQLPRTLAGDGEDDLTVHDGHMRLLQLKGCTKSTKFLTCNPTVAQTWRQRLCHSFPWSSSRTRAESARSTSTRGSCASGSCSSARRSTTTSPTSSSPSCCI